jgi:AcrR family transcriptional regulator
MASARPRPSRARRLSLEAIVESATRVIDAEGFDGLTMRKVAAGCGVTVMALYGYVRTREELVAAVMDHLLAEIPLPEIEDLSWQEQVAEVFRTVNRAFEAHPVLSELAGHQPLDSLAFYRGAELALRALRRAPLGDQDVVDALGALTSFTLGFAQRQAERRSRAMQSSIRLARIRALSADEFPTVVDLAGVLVTWGDAERHFEHGLQLVISGIEQRARSDDNNAREATS